MARVPSQSSPTSLPCPLSASGNTGERMIQVDGVSKSFGMGPAAVQAVRGISLNVHPGQVTGLLGPNGAGKTTLIRMITAYIAPTRGCVRVCGHDTLAAGDLAKRHLGYLPEAAPLYPEMSVEGYLGYRARLFGVPRAQRRGTIDSAIRRCWLTEMRSRRIGALSKGYKQRVGLAAALLHDPAVVVLDEPTSGLDPTQIREMRELIRGLATGAAGAEGEGGQPKTVLLSSHILPEVEQTCDRVVIVARGRLRADGTPDELLEPLRRAAPYSVEFASTDSASCERVLRGVPGVGAINARPAGPGTTRFEVSPTEHAPDLREPIARACASAGLLVRELSRAPSSLEQVFLRVIEQSEDDDAGRPHAPHAPAATQEAAA